MEMVIAMISLAVLGAALLALGLIALATLIAHAWRGLIQSASTSQMWRQRRHFSRVGH